MKTEIRAAAMRLVGRLFEHPEEKEWCQLAFDAVKADDEALVERTIKKWMYSVQPHGPWGLEGPDIHWPKYSADWYCFAAALGYALPSLAVIKEEPKSPAEQVKEVKEALQKAEAVLTEERKARLAGVPASPIREMAPTDWRGIMGVERACFELSVGGTGMWSMRDYEDLLHEGGSCLVWSELVGGGAFVSGCVWFQDNEIVSLGVLPERRREGVGDRLLLAAVFQISADGHKTVELDVAPNAVAAMRLYVKRGFLPTNYDPNAHGRLRGAIHMTKTLS